MTAKLRVWASQVQAGLLAGALAATFSISHASLVTGTVAPQATPTLIAMALTGTAILCLLMGLFSGITGLISLTQDVPAVALGAIVASMIQAPIAANNGADTATIAALTLTTSLIFGVVFVLAGTLRLGSLIRFAPMPMIAGFLAGTGWLVLLGAVGIATGVDVRLSNFNAMISGATGGKLATSLIVAVLLVLAPRFLPRQSALPVVLLACVVAANLLPVIIGTSRAEMTDDGWFLQFASDRQMWPPISPQEVLAVDPAIMVQNAFPMVTIVVLATIAILMNAAALELDTKTDLNLNRELRVLGVSNFLSGILGGMPGYHGVSATLASHKLADPNKLSALVAAAVVVAIVATGDTILKLFPLPVLGGFLIWVGGGLVYTWLIEAVRRSRPAEALLLVVIFVVIVQVGLFEGTVLGLLAGALLFVIDYSRMNPVRSVFFGDVYHGSTELAPDAQALLRQHGRAIAILKIQGFVFFATAHGLRMRIRDILQSNPDVRYLLIDFEAATGMDSTAVVSFHRIADELGERNMEVVLTSVGPEVRAVFDRSGFDPSESNGKISYLDDLDTGLLALETRLLAEFGKVPTGPDRVAIETVLERELGGEAARDQVMGYLEKRALEPGDVLFRQGDDADAMYFLESGNLAILLEANGDSQLLRTLHPGAVVGEIALYLGSTRSATVSAGDRSVVWQLSSDSISRMSDEAPEVLAELHAAMARALARRVEANTRLIETLRA